MAWHHPEWWAAAAAGLGWLVLVAAAVLPGLAGARTTLHPPLTAAGGHGGVVALVWCSAVMAVTMMVPLTLPALRHAALSSFWHRRHRAVAGFLGGYLAVWVPLGVVLLVGCEVLASLLGTAATVVLAFGLAASWQLAPVKRRLLSRCRRTRPLLPRGWRADWDCVQLGAGAGRSCAATCWALMMATVAGSHSVAVMAVVSGLQMSERFGRRFAPGATALVLAGLGAVVLATGGSGHG